MDAKIDDEILSHVDEMREKDLVLSFSTGADSLACYLRLKEWGIKPAALVYNYYLPGLTMVETYLRWFEREYGMEVIRIPGHLGISDIGNGLFQRPGIGKKMHKHCPIQCDRDTVNASILDCFDRDPHMVIGLRYTDGYFRYKAITEKGSVRNARFKQWNPCASFTLTDTEEIIRRHSAKLPFEYRFIGRSFESPRATVAIPMRDNAPKTWAQIKQVFPLTSNLEGQGLLVKPTGDLISRIKHYADLALEGEE